MKSQDILVLFKLISERRALEARDLARKEDVSRALPMDWEGWNDALPESEAGLSGDLKAQPRQGDDPMSVRALEASLGLSKSEISQSLKRSTAVGLASRSRSDGQLRANASALYEFLIHGLKYVFPAQPGAMVRGIPTGVDAPVLEGVLAKAGELSLVWPDPMGKIQGQAIKPLYRSVPHAVRRDAELYALLALTDAVRLGRPREVKVAADQLRPLMGLA